MADQNENQLKILERIKKLREDIYALETKEVDLTEDENNLLLNNKNLLDRLVAIQEKRLKAALGTTQSELELKSVFSSRIADLSSMSVIYSDLSKSQSEILKSSQDSLASVQQSLLVDSDKKQLLDDTVSGIFQLQDIQKQLAETGPDQVEVQNSIRDSYNSQYNKLRDSVVSKQIIGEITAEEGTALLNILELQKDSLSVAEKLSTQTTDQKEQLQKQIEAYEGIKGVVRGALGTVGTLFSGIRGAISTVMLALGDVVGKIGEMNKSLGVSLLDVGELQLSAVGLSYIFKDANDVATELASTFGTMNAGFDLQLKTNLLASNLGLAANETVALTKAFSMLNKGSTDVAADLMISTRETAKMAGVIPSAVMKDLAKNTEAFALYGKNGGKNIAEAAVFAQKLGVEMDKLTGVTDNLLDYETSITKELELSAMLGKNINLNRARALAYEGDIQGAVNETLNQLGGIEAFNQMDYYQKKQTADLLGVSVEELKTMADKQASLTQDVGLLQKGYSTFTESITALGNTFAGTVMQGAGGFLITLGQINMGLSAMGLNLASMAKRLGAWILYPFKAIGGWIMKTAAIVGNTVATVANTIATKVWSAATSIGTKIMNLSLISWAKEKLAIVGSTLARWANIAVVGAWNIITKIAVGIMSLFNIGLIREKIAIMASTAAKYANIAAIYAWNAVTKISSALMNSSLILWAREKLLVAGSTLLKWGNIAATYAWNAAMSMSNAIKSTAIGRWIAEKVQIVANTLAKWFNVGATAAAGAANATLAGSQTAVATTAGPASGGISAFGKALGSFGKSAMSAIPILIVLALAILAITPALKIVGDVIISVAQVIGGVLMKALEMLPAIISSISVGITSIIDAITNSLIKLSAIDASSFLGLAAGILAIGGAMAALGIMLPAIIAGVGSLFLLNSVLPTFASGLSQLSSVDGNALVSLGMGLIALGGAIGALGLMLPAIILGVAALGALSLVLPTLSGLGQTLSSLASIDGQALTMVSLGMWMLFSTIGMLGMLLPAILMGSAAIVALSLVLPTLGTALTSLSTIDGENLSLIGDGLFKIGQASLMIGAGIAMATIALIGLVPALPILYLVTTAFSAFGTAMLFAGIGSGMLAQSLPIISQSIQQMVEYVDGIYAISDAILKLSTSLSALSFASILAAPAMLAISLFGKQTAEAAPKEGEGGEVESFSILEQAIRETNEMLISEIRGLRDDLNSGKISVNMDGDSVTSKIVRNINRSATNMYGLKG